MPKTRKLKIQKQPAKFKHISHTADIGLAITGSDYSAVFVNAAQAMFSLIGEIKRPAKKTVEYQVCLNASDQEELLVAWLSELLALSDINQIFFIYFQINSLSKTQINGCCKAVKFNQRNIQRKTEVKAVTYHQLSIKRDKQQITAKVFLDL